MRFGEDITERAAGHGRSRGDLVILQGIGPIVGRTRQEAVDRHRAIAELVEIETALDYLGRFFDDIDWSVYDLDGPFPDLGGWHDGRDQAEREVAWPNATRGGPLCDDPDP